MYKNLTEQEWVYEFYKEKIKNNEPLIPVILGTKGTWTIGNKRKVIILVSLNIWDLMILADIHGVSCEPFREVKIKKLTYYAINVTKKELVNQIIQEAYSYESKHKQKKES